MTIITTLAHRIHKPLRAIIRPIPKLVAVFVCTFVISATAHADAAPSKPDYSQKMKTSERLIYKENYSAAIKYLEEITEAEPDNADAWNLLGFASRKIDDLQQAQAAYEKALAADPEHKGALEYQGELFIRLGDKNSAIENLEKLKILCPDGCEQLDLLQAALTKS